MEYKNPEIQRKVVIRKFKKFIRTDGYELFIALIWIAILIIDLIIVL